MRMVGWVSVVFKMELLNVVEEAYCIKPIRYFVSPDLLDWVRSQNPDSIHMRYRLWTCEELQRVRYWRSHS